MTLQYELDRYVKDHQDEWYKEGELVGEAKGEARAKASLIEWTPTHSPSITRSV